MAEYKKKNVKKLKAVKPRRSTVAKDYKITSFNENSPIDEIPVKSARQVRDERKFEKDKSKYLKKNQPKKRIVNSKKSPSELNRGTGFRILDGGKQAQLLKKIIAGAVAFCLILTVFIIHLSSPTGLIELVSNSFAKSGSGSGFPVSVGGGNVLDIKNMADAVAVVSDTNFEIYNQSGKEILVAQHDSSFPVLQTNDSRALIYDEGGTNIKVYNLSGEVFTRKMKNKIILAEMGRNGTYCVVTDPKNAASMIYVYNKNDTLLFKQSFETELINSVAISDNGKILAVATLNAKGGKYVSSIKLFNIRKEERFKEITNDGLVYSVDAVNGKNFLVCTADATYSIIGKDGTYSILEESGVQHKSERAGYANAVVYGIEGTDTSIKAVVYKNNFEKLAEYNIKTTPKKIDFNSQYFVIAKDTYLYVYGKDNSEIEIKCEYSAENFALCKDKIFVVNNSSLSCIKISDYKEQGK